MLTAAPREGLPACCLQARQLAYELLAAHGLHDWSFAFNRSKRDMGLCRYGTKAIELSIHFVTRNTWAAIRDTLLHEIAHALVGPGHGHDAIWKRTCLDVGAKPQRVSFEVDMPDGRWQARCACCGVVHHKHRKPKRMFGWFCMHCGPARGKLTWLAAAK
jgi:predicted SprT family Zn-dependent metalloprotease